MQQASEYYISLSADSKQRYFDKVTKVASLKSDPYAIGSEQWLVEPDQVPNVEWIDMFLYMVLLQVHIPRKRSRYLLASMYY